MKVLLSMRFAWVAPAHQQSDHFCSPLARLQIAQCSNVLAFATDNILMPLLPYVVLLHAQSEGQPWLSLTVKHDGLPIYDCWIAATSDMSLGWTPPWTTGLR